MRAALSRWLMSLAVAALAVALLLAQAARAQERVGDGRMVPSADEAAGRR